MLAPPQRAKHLIQIGDCREILKSYPEKSVNCCVTSPPYFGLRDYGHTGQIGLEKTPDAFVAEMVAVFREVRRVLRDNGTLWLNLGDSYARAPAKGGSGPDGKNEDRWGYGSAKSRVKDFNSKQASNRAADIDGVARHLTIGSSDGAVGTADRPGSRSLGDGIKPKDLIGIPWRVAFALQADGWYLRQDIIWHKPNPMPESVTDRCTKAHEYIFLLSKSERYYFDGEAIKEPCTSNERRPTFRGGSYVNNSTFNNAEGGKSTVVGNVRTGRASGNKKHKYTDAYDTAETEEHRTKAGLLKIADNAYETRNKRSVWSVGSKPFKEAHFATFPPALIEPCILAGCPEGGIVLDPFGGAGTTGLVATQNKRRALLIELNAEYAAMAERRILGTLHA